MIRPTTLKRLWDEDRWPLAVTALSAVAATVAWGGVTRPMGDSASYRAAGLTVLNGWHEITDRTPGYPLLLWATGSLRTETTLLFAVQLALHCASVVMVVVIARSIGLPKMARVAIAVLLCMPPTMVKVVYSGSEALTEFLVVLSLWLFLRWLDSRSMKMLLALGSVLAALAWVRPTFQLVWLPVAMAVWFVMRRRGAGSGQPGRVLGAAYVAVPAILLVGSLVVFNGVRFGQWEMTPMFGWFLGSRTSAYVEELPASEPLRKILVDERDRRLLLGAETDAENYQFAIEDRLSETTGLSGADLDAHMLRLNLGLIAAHPFEYLTQVQQSLFNLTQMDAEPAASGPGRIGGWLQSLGHLVLMVGFAISLLTLPGLALAGYVGRRTLAALGYCVMLTAYVAAVSALVETGSPRLRAPTDPLLVLFMVTGWTILAGLGRSAVRLRE